MDSKINDIGAGVNHLVIAGDDARGNPVAAPTTSQATTDTKDEEAVRGVRTPSPGRNPLSPGQNPLVKPLSPAAAGALRDAQWAATLGRPGDVDDALRHKNVPEALAEPLRQEAYWSGILRKITEGHQVVDRTERGKLGFDEGRKQLRALIDTARAYEKKLNEPLPHETTETIKKLEKALDVVAPRPDRISEERLASGKATMADALNDVRLAGFFIDRNGERFEDHNDRLKMLRLDAESFKVVKSAAALGAQMMVLQETWDGSLNVALRLPELAPEEEEEEEEEEIFDGEPETLKLYPSSWSNDLQAIRRTLAHYTALRQQVPDALLDLYTFVASADRKLLAVNPMVRKSTSVMRGGGFTSRDTAAGGKVIALEHGGFESAGWIKGTLADHVTSEPGRRQLEEAGYDINTPCPLLVARDDNNEPVTFAFSMKADLPSMACICSEVTVLKMNGNGDSPHVTVRKPVIYLYPSESMEVRVRVNIAGEFSALYPSQDASGEWRVWATPTGALRTSTSDRTYPYLFWEAKRRPFALVPELAHLVTRHQAVDFLEALADACALNDRERTDFVTYWMPALQANERSLVQLLGDAEYGAYAPMTVTPKPDTTIRLFMIFRSAQAHETGGNPTLQRQERRGFTVVEWGGCNLDE